MKHVASHSLLDSEAKSTSAETLSGIDIAKLFFAFCIVGLHTGVFYNFPIGYYIHTMLFRLGVPFFFFCSGYFISKKVITCSDRKEVFFSTIKKLLVVYLLWNLIYVPISLYRSNSFTPIALLSELYNVLLLRSHTIMWFVGSLILSLLLIFHIKEKYLKQALFGAFVLYLVGLLFNTYRFIFLGTQFEALIIWLTSMFGSNSNAWFCGFLFTGLGYYIALADSPSIQKKSMQNVFNIDLLFCGIALLTLEVNVVHHHLDVVTNYEYYLGHVLIIPAMFLLVKRIPISVPTAVIRKLSSYIYYSHMLVIVMLLYCTEKWNLSLLNNPTIQYITVILITVLISMAYHYGKQGCKHKQKNGAQERR